MLVTLVRESGLRIGVLCMTRRIIRGQPKLTDPDAEDTRKLYLRKAHAMSDVIEMTDDMRHDLARMIVTVDEHGTGSWADLTVPQLHELIMMLEGYVFIRYMKENE